MKKYGLRLSLAASVCMLAAGLGYAFDSEQFATLRADMDVARKVISADVSADATSALSYKQTRQSSKLVDADAKALEPLALNTATTTAGTAPLHAVMMYSSEWTQDTGEKKGIYSLPTDGTSTTPTEVKLDNIFTECAYAVGMPDKFHFGQVQRTYGVILSLTQYTYKTADWTPLSTLKGDISSRNFQASDAAYNPVTTDIYGSVLDIKANTWGIYRIENETALTFKYVASLDAPFVAMDFDKDGNLYAVTQDGKFISYDIVNKKATTIATGMPLSTKYTSGAIDNVAGKFYYAVCNDNQSALCSIDLTTGAVGKLYDFAHGEEFVGMYYPSATSTDVVPSAPTNVKYTFTGTDLKGSLSFDAPKTTTDGTAGSGELTYTVFAGNNKVAEGKTAFGETVTTDVEVPTNGDFTFTVRVANSNGQSAAGKVSGWIGADSPNMLSTAPTVSYANGKATIKWSSPYGSKGPNGGYVDRTKYTYTVVRNNDGKVIADNISTTSTTDEFEAPESLTFYTYDVTVHYEGATSQPMTSAKLAVGNIIPPFAVDFESDPMSLFTYVDGNKDYKYWSYSSVYKRLHLAQNTTKAMDDWLFMHPMSLKAGNIYKLTFDTYGGAANTKQKMAVFLGTAPDAESMTTLTIMPETEYTNVEKTPLTVSYDMEVPVDGLYYLGFHALSEPSNNYICLTNIKVAAGTNVASPAPVSNFTVSPDMNGALKAEISLTAPTKTLKDAVLTNLTAVEVRMGNTVVKTFENPKPGDVCNFTYVTENRGETEFTAVAINDKGESQEVTATAFIGLTAPVAPATTSIVENTPGNLTLKWSQVTKDQNSKNLNPATLTYTIMELDQNMLQWKPIVDDIVGLTHTWQYVKPDAEQDFISLAMATNNEYGRSKYRAVDQIPVGAPYTLPYFESNTNGYLKHCILTKQFAGDGYARWRQGTNATIEGMVAADGDNGYLYMTGEKVGDKVGMISGKIDLTNATTPIFSIAFVQFKDDKNKVSVDIMCEGDTTLIGEWVAGGDKSMWVRKDVALDQFKGKTIQYIVYGELVTSDKVFVDCIEIRDYPQKDVAITAISGPKTLSSLNTEEVKVLVENLGLDNVSGHKVVFYVNNEPVSTIDATNTLGFKEQAIYSCKLGATPMSDDEYNVYAEIIFDGDMVAENNKSDKVVIEVIKPTMPSPQNLTAKADENNTSVTLTWEDAPETVLKSSPVTEYCEKYESFSINGFGDWTTIDADKSVSNLFSSIDVPHMGKEAFGFMLFDASGSQFNSTFAARSGNKYFMAFTNEAQACDDWLISPELNGAAQTISFYARGYHPDYPESFEILYSSTGKEIADFTMLKSFDKVGYTFTEYTAALPAGAKYFAIRCTSKNAFMLIVDDISFSPVNGLAVESYNVYNNGEMLAAGVKEKTYVHNLKAKATNSYNVTANYNYGESAASEAAVVDLSGVEDAFAASVNVAVSDRTITVTGAEGCQVAIYNTTGVCLLNTVSNGNTTYEAVQGIYLVKVADRSYKVVVK